MDGKKQIIGGLGIIKESLLKELDIAHKHEVVILDVDTKIFTDYRSYSTKVEDIIVFPIVSLSAWIWMVTMILDRKEFNSYLEDKDSKKTFNRKIQH